jgi:LemA protein
MDSLEPFIFIFFFLIFVSVAWYITTYNKFIKYKNRIEEAWSGIDVALKRRFNLIPNLINAVRGYEEHEAEVLQQESRRFTSSTEIPDRMEEESRLSRSLHGLLALAEAYPDLKASENFLSLMNSLNDIEQDIQQARNQYNAAVRQYNTLTESFPSIYIARKYGFGKVKYFTLELATLREMPKLDFSSPPVD